MNYQTIILKILGCRQYVICHKNLLLHELDEDYTPADVLEDWCFQHGIEMTSIEGNMILLARKPWNEQRHHYFLS